MNDGSDYPRIESEWLVVKLSRSLHRETITQERDRLSKIKLETPWPHD